MDATTVLSQLQGQWITIGREISLDISGSNIHNITGAPVSMANLSLQWSPVYKQWMIHVPAFKWNPATLAEITGSSFQVLNYNNNLGDPNPLAGGRVFNFVRRNT